MDVKKAGEIAVGIAEHLLLIGFVLAAYDAFGVALEQRRWSGFVGLPLGVILALRRSKEK